MSTVASPPVSGNLVDDPLLRDVLAAPKPTSPPTSGKTTGRTLRIVDLRIEVTEYPSGERYVHFRGVVIFPGCRKRQLWSLSPVALYISVTPLFGHNGFARLSPADYLRLVDVAPVVPDRLHPMEITPAVVEWAKAQVAELATCPAVTDPRDMHPDYAASLRFDDVTIE